VHDELHVVLDSDRLPVGGHGATFRLLGAIGARVEEQPGESDATTLDAKGGGATGPARFSFQRPDTGVPGGPRGPTRIFVA
jgi:hypothetical protein